MKPVLALSLLLLAPVARAADSTYADFLTTARTQFEAKNFDAARASMQSALGVAKTPDEKYGALFRIAKTFDEQKNFTQARPLYAQAAAQTGISASDKVQALFSVGVDFREEKRPADAQKTFESLLADPQSLGDFAEVVRFNLGQLLVDNAQADKGRALLSAVGESKTLPAVRASAWLEVARSWREQKGFDAALIATDKALAVPDAPLFFAASAHSERARIFSAQNDAPRAQKEKSDFVFEMLKPLGTSTPAASFARIVSTPPQLDPKKKDDVLPILERLSAALFVVDGDKDGPQEEMSFVLRAQIAAIYGAAGDFASEQAGWKELLSYFAPTSKVAPELRAKAAIWQSVSLWKLGLSFEASGDGAQARANWQQLVQLPGAQADLKALAQKKLDAK